MKKYKTVKIILIALVLTICCTPKEKPLDINLKTSFSENWESIKKNYKDPEWFNNSKFGIFVHWGAYAVPAYGSEWYPRNMYMDTANFSAQLNLINEGPTKEFLHHKKKWGDQKQFGYKDFIP